MLGSGQRIERETQMDQRKSGVHERSSSAIPAPIAPPSIDVVDVPRTIFERLWRRSLAYYIYRHRYLACFTVIGLFSILLELAVLHFLPTAWPQAARIVTAFVVGAVFSLVLNVTINFHVPRRYLLRSSAWFIGISAFSFVLNLAVITFLHANTELTYGWLRLVISGALFAIAYTLHRTFTFNQSRNFGIAIYASENEDVSSVFESIGHCCDHVHVDLVDETVLESVAPVRLDRIDEVRRLWHGFEVCLHVMSRRPRQWAEATWGQIDWYLFTCDVDDDLMELIFDCRFHGKKVGVVWNSGIPLAQLLPYLPHVDFVMVLGIAQPGRSGQTLDEHCLAVARTLDSMRSMYQFELIFDGGVKPQNISHIPGRYIVSASAVLTAARPTTTAHYLRMSEYERRPSRRNAA